MFNCDLRADNGPDNYFPMVLTNELRLRVRAYRGYATQPMGGASYIYIWAGGGGFFYPDPAGTKIKKKKKWQGRSEKLQPSSYEKKTWYNTQERSRKRYKLETEKRRRGYA